jgi:hypothetical protein
MFIVFLRNFVILYLQIGIIFKYFFHKNIIEQKFTHFIFGWNYIFIFIRLLHFSANFQELYSTRMKKSNEDIILPKCGFNFLLANWFNYLKSIIQFKTFTNIYNVKITHFTLLSSWEKMNMKMNLVMFIYIYELCNQ